MSQQFHRASTGDTVTVPDALVKKYDADPRWERVDQAAAVDLRGKELDAAVKKANEEGAEIPSSATADEKRALLAAHTPNTGEENDR